MTHQGKWICVGSQLSHRNTVVKRFAASSPNFTQTFESAEEEFECHYAISVLWSLPGVIDKYPTAIPFNLCNAPPHLYLDQLPSQWNSSSVVPAPLLGTYVLV
ncbi:hypothetical protein CDAR_246201 [Caerostris darwini]|uniref:Uncharacterized protein n=1 Tax=Caerostris darwini TaxID=1538125 RepID=A0AAV4W8Y4_9ARAC|nr:hypothetical protein CDAR_246201 [Caerostris darwini]